MPGVVKKGIGLRKDQDEKLEKLVASQHRKYSTILQEAVDRYLESMDVSALESEYASYYADAENVKKNSALAKEMWNLSKDTCPK